jgi:hypothetical protein
MICQEIQRPENHDRLVLMRGSREVMRARYTSKYGFSLAVLQRWARVTKYTEAKDAFKGSFAPAMKLRDKHGLYGSSFNALHDNFFGSCGGNRDRAWINGQIAWVDTLELDQCRAIGDYRRTAEKFKALGL